MKIELPLETWTDIFGFVPRSQLKQLVLHVEEEQGGGRWWNLFNCCKRKQKQTISDRQFISFVQFYLQKFGEVTLGNLHIIAYRNESKPNVIVNGKAMPLAVVPIPENVKNFKSICISNSNESTIAFLQKFQQNSLLTNVNMHFHENFLLTANLLPLFTNINSIKIHDLLDQIQCESEYSELATPMLTSARVLFSYYNCRDYWFCDWLHIPREDGKPRILFLHGSRDGDSFSPSPFIEHIKKDFLDANQAFTFFIKLVHFRGDANVPSLTLENSQTQEKMVIKRKIRGYNSLYVSISRYPMGINEKKWVEEMSHRLHFGNRKIEFIALNR